MNTETPLDMSHANPPLFAALAKAQAELENASKTSRNDHFRSSYADLAEVLNKARPVLSAHGISVIQSPSFDGAQVHCETILAHCEGGWIAGRLSCVPAKCDGQGIGAATTYLRRYSLAAMVGLAQEDDDGNSAAHNSPPAPPARKAAVKKPPATPPVDPRRKGWIDDLKSAYLAAGVPDGNQAGEMLRKAGLLGVDERVPDMTADALEAAWKVRFEVFPPPAE